ncbi:MAG: hypothetical protein HPY76_04030 [Anaerolineae bacterium]|nr:hypothetical protein [Anaerolineae bacterium]
MATISTLGAIPVIGFLSGLDSLFGLFLNVLALHRVMKLSWGKAIPVLLMPVILAILLFGCGMILLAPAIITTFQDAIGQFPLQ